MTKRLEKILVPVVFGIYLLIGILIHSDYGVSWDEPISRMNGLVNLKYVETRFAPSMVTDDMKSVPDLNSWPDRDYGVAFELPLAALEQVFGVGEEGLYSFRHLFIFLFSSLGVMAVYKTAKFVYGDYKLGILAALMLVLSPRMFGESFYNSKDIVFMAAMAMAIYTMTRLIATPRLRWAIVHGMITAYAIDVRIMGVLIVAATIGILVVRVVKKEVPLPRTLACVLVYLAATSIIVVALFPFLWTDPVSNFLATFGNMAKFRWNNWVLYLGSSRMASDLPWHYIPVWIFVTTPLVFSVLMIVGFVRGVRVLLKNRLSVWASDRQMAELAYLAILFFPALAIIAMRSVVYDGWRHLYFIYPAFVLVAVGGFAALMKLGTKYRSLRIGVLSVLAITFCGNVYWIVKSHPLQNVYFNSLAGGNWKDKFDLDYWGMGNREALEAVLRDSDSQTITIRAISATPLDRALLTMRREERDRFFFSSSDSKSQFVLTNYRSDEFCEGLCELTDYDLYYQKKIGPEVVVSVFKIRDPSLADKVSRNNRAYSAEEFRQLSYRITRRYMRGRQTYVDLEIGNAGPEPIAAASSVERPVRVSWRFLDARGVPMEGWNTRRELPRDIPAHGQVTVSIPIGANIEAVGGTLQVSLLQEQVFWGHDVGIPDATLPWTTPGT